MKFILILFSMLVTFFFFFYYQKIYIYISTNYINDLLSCNESFFNILFLLINIVYQRYFFVFEKQNSIFTIFLQFIYFFVLSFFLFCIYIYLPTSVEQLILLKLIEINTKQLNFQCNKQYLLQNPTKWLSFFNIYVLTHHNLHISNL